MTCATSAEPGTAAILTVRAESEKCPIVSYRSEWAEEGGEGVGEGSCLSGTELPSQVTRDKGPMNKEGEFFPPNYLDMPRVYTEQSECCILICYYSCIPGASQYIPDAILVGDNLGQ